ncbi:MAG: hypothetical protein K2W33_16920 [Burkholderiales bacterium]|nr:hypothetical protein [Burkholderiales bacterium]
MVYLKTDAGQLAFKQRSPDISQKQRSAFLQFDGQRSLAAVLQAVQAIGITPADIADLVTKGFLAPAAPAGHAIETAHTTPPAPVLDGDDKQRRYQAAYPIAVSLCAGLGLRGFTLTLAVEAASGYADLLALLPKLDAALPPGRTGELKRALGLA